MTGFLLPVHHTSRNAAPSTGGSFPAPCQPCRVFLLSSIPCSLPDVLKGWLRVDTPKSAPTKVEGEGECTTDTPGPKVPDLVVQAVNDIISR